jgi:tRNA G10  N-methylase Trm11
MQTLIVHGRQPALGKAELESLYGADILRPAGDNASLLDIEPTSIDFMRLGGMVKFCKVLTILDTTKWDDIEKFLVNTTPQHFSVLPDGKLKIGLSVYGIKASPKRIQASALEIKKAGKTVGRSIRIVPNKGAAMNSAQVLHNKLTQKLGWELVFVRDGDKTILAQSIAVQDIDAYAARDQKRPYRDSRVGMLPPKLAQTIINLAGGKNETKTVLDPFCGTGVVMQEALLMGFSAHGTDLEPRMVEYSEKNLQWLKQTSRRPIAGWTVEQADATNYEWGGFDAIAGETYLGRPLSSLPDPNILNKIIQDCDTIHKKFLKNVARQTKPGLRMCIAVPAWKKKDGFAHLPTLEKLSELGYTRLSFEGANEQELIYHRPDQTVARELVVLIRK